MSSQQQQPPQAAVPADVDAADTIAWGLTARQLATLATAGTIGYGIWQLAATWVSPIVLAIVATPLAGLVIAVVLGRRDGLPLDRWLLSAARFVHTPRRQAPTASPSAKRQRGGRAGWLVRTTHETPAAAALHLPVRAISSQGILHGPHRPAAVVACGTINLGLRTSDEQTAMLSGFGRWLNSLSCPTQLVVSTQPFDLQSHAEQLLAGSDALPHPALSAAAKDHAAYLTQLAAERDPLRRQVLCLLAGEAGQPTSCLRRAEATARAIAGLGAHTDLLDGTGITAALRAAADPYQPPVPGARATPGTSPTSHP